MKNPISNERQTWVIEDHLCRFCGGRILRCVIGSGITGGGNPLFKCADCGKTGSGLGPEVLCWCGFSHRLNTDNPYRCLPFSILKEHPKLLNGFRSCGCDTNRGEVGIILKKEYTENLKQSMSNFK